MKSPDRYCSRLLFPLSILSLILSNSIHSICRPPVQVSDGNDQNFGFESLVDYALGEPMRLSMLGVRVPRSLKLPDSFKGGKRFEQELITEPWRSVVVILDRLV